MLAPMEVFMSELALALLAVIQRKPIHFADLWEEVDVSYGFEEMQSALAELIDDGHIQQIDSTFAFRVVSAAA